jgi:hypothetical protein
MDVMATDVTSVSDVISISKTIVSPAHGPNGLISPESTLGRGSSAGAEKGNVPWLVQSLTVGSGVGTAVGTFVGTLVGAAVGGGATVAVGGRVDVLTGSGVDVGTTVGSEVGSAVPAAAEAEG